MQTLYLQKQADLERVLSLLSQNDSIAIDTEFDNNHYRYGFSFCLLQIATATTCYLIDPYEIKDLSGLWKVLENPRIEKIFHDCGEDMRLFYRYQCKPKNIFDTSVAVKLLGYERIGLGSVLKEVLNVDFDKKKQYSNWTIRPLSEPQLQYAAQDVLYLKELRERLYAQLQAQKRVRWFEQSMQQLERKNYAPETRTTFLSQKEQRELSPFDQYMLNELYRFRDQQAQRLNRPVYQVIPDAVIHQILQQPTLLKNWLSVKGIHPRMLTPTVAEALRNVYQESVQRAINQGLSRQVLKPSAAVIEESQKRLRQQRQLKEQLFVPIKKQIELTHGAALAPYILSNENINALAAGNTKIGETMTEHQREIILAAAQALNLDIQAFL